MSAPVVYWHASGSGGSGTANVVVDLGQPAAAGHSLIVGYNCPGGVLTGPAGGWTLDDTNGAPMQYWYRLPETAGGEQQFTVVNNAANVPAAWCIWETDKLDPFSAYVDQGNTAPFHPATGVTTLSTGATTDAVTPDTLCLAMHLFYWSTGTTAWSSTASWAGQDGGFTEDEETSIATGFSFLGMAASSRSADGVTGPFSSTATLTTTVTRNVTNDTFAASVVGYRGPSVVTMPAGGITVA